MAGLFSFQETLNKVVRIPLDLIDPNPMQPRKRFSERQITELAASIAANGLLQPIVVRRLPQGRYELVAGHRRLLAFRQLGKPGIPAIVESMDDRASAVMAVVENLQRQDLGCFEEAEGIAALLALCEMNQTQVAMQLGKAPSTIANKLRLLKLPAEARARIAEAGLTERHARALLALADSPALFETIETIVAQGWNVESTEKYLEKLLLGKVRKPMRLVVIKDLRIFVNTVNKAVETMLLAGIPVSSSKTEDDKEICYTIRVPKASAYKKKSTA